NMYLYRIFPLAFRILALGIFLFGMAGKGYGQEKVLAKYESKSINGVSGETNVNTDDDTYAEVKAYGGALLGAGAYSGSIQMKFDETIPANQWSYIRVELAGGLTDVLLGGSLGNALGE